MENLVAGKEVQCGKCLIQKTDIIASERKKSFTIYERMIQIVRIQHTFPDSDNFL